MSVSSMSPEYSNPMQWQQNIGLARAACARIFRDGGAPVDALRAFHLEAFDAPSDWSIVVDRIAAALSQPIVARKAA